MEIDNATDWRKKTEKTIHLIYGKALYYQDYIDFIRETYEKEWKYLSDLDIYIMDFLLEHLGCDTKVYYDRDYDFQGSKTAMLVDMCKKLECDTYLSNLGSSAYVQISEFVEAGLHHQYIDYQGITYRQQFAGFEPGLSILDMLMNCGRDKTREILLDRSLYSFSEIDRNIEVSHHD